MQKKNLSETFTREEYEEIRARLGIAKSEGTLEDRLRDIGVRNEHTLISYTRVIRDFQKKEGILNTERCRRYVKSFYHLKPRSINVIVSALRKYAELQGVSVDLRGLVPKIEYKIPQVLTVEEVKKMIEYAGKYDVRDKAIISLLYDCALRSSELVNLDCDDVNLEEGLIVVKERKNKPGIPQVIPFWDETKKTLKSYFEERERRGFTKETDPWLFIGREGRLSQRSVNYVVEYVSERAIGRKINPHLLRHSKAVHLRQKGVTMEDLKDFLGHTNVNTTFLYARIVPTEMKKFPRTLC